MGGEKFREGRVLVVLSVRFSEPFELIQKCVKRLHSLTQSRAECLMKHSR